MEFIQTSKPEFTLRFATPDDAGLVLSYMHKLGTYQKMRDKITATEADFHRLLSEGRGETIFGQYDGETVAFIYFYQNSSAFTGQTGLYIDGFLVDEAMKGKGLGKIMMAICHNSRWNEIINDWSGAALTGMNLQSTSTVSWVLIALMKCVSTVSGRNS